MLSIKVTFPGVPFKTKMAGLGDRIERATTTSMNMIASMILERGRADIASAGNFGSRWVDGLTTVLSGAGANMVLALTHNIPFAGIFETGGTINGRPLLWIPLSGTDAEGVRASEYSGGLFSTRYPRKSGPPLLFSRADKQPRYFGIESVTIPKTFHLTEDVLAVMANFKDVFRDAWQRS